MAIGSVLALQSDPTQIHRLRRQQEPQVPLARDAGTGASAGSGRSAVPAASGANPFASRVKVDLSMLNTVAPTGSTGADADGNVDDARQSSATSDSSLTPASHTLGSDMAALLKALGTGDPQSTQMALQELTSDLGATDAAGLTQHSDESAARASNAPGQFNAVQTAYQFTLSLASDHSGDASAVVHSIILA